MSGIWLHVDTSRAPVLAYHHGRTPTTQETRRRRTDGSLWRPDPAVLRWPPVRVQRVIPAVRLGTHGTVQEDAVPGGRQDRDLRQRAGGQPDPGAARGSTALPDLTVWHEVVDGQDRVTQRGGRRLATGSQRRNSAARSSATELAGIAPPSGRAYAPAPGGPA